MQRARVRQAHHVPLSLHHQPSARQHLPATQPAPPEPNQQERGGASLTVMPSITKPTSAAEASFRLMMQSQSGAPRVKTCSHSQVQH